MYVILLPVGELPGVRTLGELKQLVDHLFWSMMWFLAGSLFEPRYVYVGM